MERPRLWRENSAPSRVDVSRDGGPEDPVRPVDPLGERAWGGSSRKPWCPRDWSKPGERGTEGMPSSLPPNASRERVRLCPGLPPPDARGDCDSGLLTGNASSAAAARLEGPGPAALGSTTGSLGEGEPGLDLDFSETPVSLLNQPIEPRRSGEPTTQFLDGSVPFVRGARTRWVPPLSLAMLTRGVRALVIRHAAVARLRVHGQGQRLVVVTRRSSAVAETQRGRSSEFL